MKQEQAYICSVVELSLKKRAKKLYETMGKKMSEKNCMKKCVSALV
jgi:hypothetical protein